MNTTPEATTDATAHPISVRDLFVVPVRDVHLLSEIEPTRRKHLLPYTAVNGHRRRNALLVFMVYGEHDDFAFIAGSTGEPVEHADVRWKDCELHGDLGNVLDVLDAQVTL